MIRPTSTIFPPGAGIPFVHAVHARPLWRGGARSLGAYHSELAYVFDNLNTVGIGWESDDHLLSAIADYWSDLAQSGNLMPRVPLNGCL